MIPQMGPRANLFVLAVTAVGDSFAFAPVSAALLPSKAPVGGSARRPLRAAQKETQNEAIARRGERKGFYVRPSAAIEKGGGFFIPGFEGWKLRGLISSVLGVLLVLNRGGAYEPTPSQLVSEAIASTAVLLLVFQTATQLFGFGDAVVGASSSEGDLVRKAFARPGAGYESAMWAANALLDTSKGSVAILFRNGEVEAFAGSFEQGNSLMEQGASGSMASLTGFKLFLEQKCIVLDRTSPQAASLLAYAPISCKVFAVRVSGPACFWVVGSSDATLLQAEKQQAWLESISSFTALGL